MKYNNWDVDLKRANANLEILKNKIFSNCNVKSVENSDNEILLWLDKYAGIDYILKTKEQNIIGVASRIQWGANWRTFTIRYKRKTGNTTEYEKRLKAIKNGYFYPSLTLQAYFDNDNNFLEAALTKTEELYEFIEANKERITRKKSDNEFLVIRWEDIAQNKIWFYR